MPDGAAVWVSYGAPGLLVILFLGAGRLGQKVVDRWFVLADKFEAALDSYQKEIRSAEASADKRHAETRLYIETAMKETRHDMRDMLNVSSGRLSELISRESESCRIDIAGRWHEEDKASK
jgi:hypothetical protein